MKAISVVARFLFCVVAIVVVAAMLLLPRLNDFQRDGTAQISALRQPVTVSRDENGMAYVRAETLLDAIRAQGYVTAQDRLFQMQLTRTAVGGRLAELFGDDLLDRDKRQRTLGFYRAARKHASVLDEQTRAMLQAYADGVNAFIRNGSLPLELRLIGIQPQPWEIVDTLAILYFMGWGSAADLSAELLTQAIIDKVGEQRFLEIAPLNINPDDSQSALLGLRGDSLWASADTRADASALTSTVLQTLRQHNCCRNQLQLGSNNWALSGGRSPGGKPVVVNDPHLDTSMLPTTLYPIGLFTPQLRAVGVNVPGLPGIIFGRNQTVAAGGTNAYADAQDVYIETLDLERPGHYLEGDVSVPFEIIEEQIKIRDKSHDSGMRTELHQIRLTRRGPLLSDLNDTDAPEQEGKAISVRWSPYESMGPRLGLDYLLRSQSVADIRRSIADATVIHLNLIFADAQGALGWQVTGRIPRRRNNDGGRPVSVVDGVDNWDGWVPSEQMPSRYEHPNGWVGTANQRTDFATSNYFYSHSFSPDFRYRRMKELFDDGAQITSDQHWGFMRDDLNLLARDVVPVMVQALEQNPDTQKLAEVLEQWDFRDSAEAKAPVVFHEIWRRMVAQTYGDELGQGLVDDLAATPYFWSQRMRQMLLDGQSEWFDNTNTERRETVQDVIQASAIDALQSISDQLGDDIALWRWGSLHRMEVVNPLRREGVGRHLLGGGSHSAGGSAHTLYRGVFDMTKPGNQVVYSAALRMVVDLADDKKVTAVIPGGVSGRLFTKNYVDQIDEYLSGEKLYWWFDDQSIEEHSISTLTLTP